MTIYIQNLSFKAILGILSFERTSPQNIEVDCEITYRYKQEKNNYIDYAKVASLIESTMKSEKFLLVEDALERLFQIIKDQFPQIESMKITIYKPDIIPNCRVSVSDFRSYL